VTKAPGSIEGLDRDAARLYELIWKQFVACQMPPAEFDRTTIVVSAGEYELRANGRVMRFDGWMRVLPPLKTGEEDAVLPEVKVGEKLGLIQLDPMQHFTKPPARYTEASLVKELEKRGIGRPSTYASIISTIQERGYVMLEKRRFFALKIGEIVTDRLVENFQALMDYEFTAGMEGELDEIANGGRDWKQTLDSFYADFKQQLAYADLEMRLNRPIPVDVVCPRCGAPMIVRTAGTGSFLSCSAYEKPVKERCTMTMNLIPAAESAAVSESEDEGSAEEVLSKKRCPVCTTAMDSWLLDQKRRLHICGNSPDCPGVLVEFGEFVIKGYEGPKLDCDKCGEPMQLKAGRFGKYFACTNAACKNTRKLMRNGQPAPAMMTPIPMPELKCEKSDAHFILREGLVGLFLAAHTFPKSRETRSPLVEDLARHRNELDPRFHYLAAAPTTDPDGNKTLIKFNRKERFHYLASSVEGKAKGWQGVLKQEQWKWKKR
jgi:DNA topoisomerase I